MPNRIKPRRSYTANSVPLTTDLEPHELAINWVDGKAFTKDASGNIVSVTLGGSGGGGGSLTGSVTIPASGDPLWSNVSLLLPMDGSGSAFVDNGPTPKTVSAFGNVTQSTAQSKFGGKSALFDGNGDYLTVPDSADFDFTGDFTIEAWVYLTGYSGPNDGQYYAATIAAHYNAANGGANVGWLLRINGTSSSYTAVNFYTGVGSEDYEWSHSFALNTWYHVAVSRSGSSLRAFVNGSQIGNTVANSTAIAKTNSDPLFIGRMNDGTYTFWMLGHIDDLRITKAARYEANFTAPAAALPRGFYTPAQTLTVTGSGGGSGLTWSSVPASATATGTAGQIAYDGSYFYLAPANNTWVRAALSTWTPFTPASVTGLQLWLDASDASSLYDATSGGSLVAADGAVARWEDKSGNGRHATQSTSANRPLRKSAIQGGKDVLRFDGSNDSLSISGSASAMKFLHSADSTVFLVLSRPAGGYQPLIGTGDTGTATVGFNWYLADGSSSSDKFTVMAIRGVGGTNVLLQSTANGFLPSGFSVLSHVCRPTDATAANRSSVRRNGGSAVAENASTSEVSTANASYDLKIAGDNFSGGETFAAFDCSELIIYNAALSSTDRAAVESYLMTKWGIS